MYIPPFNLTWLQCTFIFQAKRCAAWAAYPHQDQSFGFGFLGLRQVKIHLVAVKVGVVRRAHALVEAKRSVRFDSGLRV